MSRPAAFRPSPLAAALFLVVAGPALAESPGPLSNADKERWALCPALPPLPAVPAQAGEVTTINADQATAQESDKSVFTGNVVIVREGRQLDTDQATYDRTNDTVDVNGNVQLFTKDFSIWGESGQFHLGDNTGVLNSTRFRVQDAHAFGTAEHVKIEGSERSQLIGATYTTCSPGHESWLLEARTLDLDRGTNTGEAYNVTLNLGGVPVLYTPYLNFALQGRKSGLLPPVFGSAGRNGDDYAVPYYWNIAPNRDATITPRYLTARGAMLKTEFRYLNADSSGQLNADGLPNDKLYQGENRERGIFRLTHAQTLTDRWSANVLMQAVSDPAYLNDIDSTLAAASSRYLERNANVNYVGNGWTFLGRVQDFQPLLLGSTDYERLPQLVASGAGRADRVHYDFRTEYVNFANPMPVPTGSRADLYPGVSLPVGNSWWYLKPRVAARMTQYELKGPVDEPAPSRSVPITSLDGGLAFERELEMFSTPLVQTLEPRLYYLYVPYRDQGKLPLFDTGPMTFSFEQLFRENRFSGADRVGDANQVTAAVTSRLLRDDNGVEAVRMSVGQIYYVENPRVVLPGQTLEPRHSSDLAAEVAAHPLQAMEISAATRWNPEIANAEESAARIRYRTDANHLFDAAWSYRGAGKEVSRDVLVLWPVTPRWQFVGRWFYDLVAERTLESVVGLQYQTCCWSVRGVVRDKPFLNASNQLQSDRSIYFTIELKGLASFGNTLSSVIDQGMVGL